MNGLDIRSPATIFDMAEHGGARTALQWAIVKEMHAGGHSWIVRRGETVLGLFGVYPVDEHTGEAWFNVRPAAASSTLRLLRAIRLTLHDLPYREILTICITPQGARVAAAAGFKRDAPCDIGEIWKWHSC